MRADVDDTGWTTPPRGRPQGVFGFRHEAERRHHVDLVQFVPDGWRGRLEIGMRDDPADAGVVDQNIETTPAGDGLLHQRDPVGVIAQVGLDVCGIPEFGG